MSIRKLLCLDLGNSSLKAMTWLDGEAGEPIALAGDCTAAWMTELGPLLSAAGDRAALCSVRPSLADPLAARLLAADVELVHIRGDSQVPFPVAVQSRETLGADRLCNAAAAWAAGLAPALIIDAGTAMTADLVDGSGVFRGGAILPGAALSLKAMAGGGEQLRVTPPGWPDSPWGADTDRALAAGAHWGQLAAAEGLTRRYRREWGAEAPVILTGGGAADLAERWLEGAHQLVPDWTLRGLAALAGCPAASVFPHSGPADRL
jgi:type III pantothenate kinase